MREFTVRRCLDAPRERVWQALTQPGCFENWLPAKPGTAVLDVQTGGTWAATVVSGGGQEIPLTGRYHEVREPDRMVMTLPGGTVTAITLTPASTGSTEIAYSFDIDESMQAAISDGVDDVLRRVSAVLARIG
jgi:uncharacterized protein YndB with AHSA1/START domain